MNLIPLAAAGLLFVSGCREASVQAFAGYAGETQRSPAAGEPRTPDGEQEGADALEARVRAYWTLRQQKNLPGMYAFYCAAYRSRVSETEFLQLSRLTKFPLLHVRLTNATLAGDRAEVTLEIASEAPEKGIPRFASETTEVWLRGPDGHWCKEDEPLLLPTPPATPAIGGRTYSCGEKALARCAVHG